MRRAQVSRGVENGPKQKKTSLAAGFSENIWSFNINSKLELQSLLRVPNSAQDELLPLLHPLQMRRRNL